jgi:hypothetical protein
MKRKEEELATFYLEIAGYELISSLVADNGDVVNHRDSKGEG